MLGNYKYMDIRVWDRYYLIGIEQNLSVEDATRYADLMYNKFLKEKDGEKYEKNKRRGCCSIHQ